MPIPRRIIQTGRSEAALSDEERKAVGAIKALHPGYEHVFFDDEAVVALVHDDYPEYREIFDTYEVKIQKFDFFRYLAVYKLGGFYFDLDVYLDKPLDDLLECSAAFPFEKITIFEMLRKRGMLGQLGNYAFGASAANPFLGKVIEYCVRAAGDRAWTEAPTFPPLPALREMLYVYYSTGPGIVSRVWIEHPELRDEVEVLFPGRATDSQRFGEYGVHWHAGSWKESDDPLTDWWLRRLNSRARRMYGERDPSSLLPRVS